MSTKIEWTNETWNVVTGCSPVSPACDNCYAKSMARRLKGMGSEWYRNGFFPTPHQELLGKPKHWRKPRMVFTCSMGDLFHSRIPFSFIAAVFVVMINNPTHTFQVLTKRPGRMRSFFEWLFDGQNHLGEASRLTVSKVYDYGLGVTEELRQTMIHIKDGKWWPRNIWGGVTVETQDQIERVRELQQCPFNVRFLSLEPLLGPIELSVPEIGEPPTWPPEYHLPNAKEWDDWKFWQHRDNGIHWVIVGGESGQNARPMNQDWARSIRDQCAAQNIPFFFKQWGEWYPQFTAVGDHPRRHQWPDKSWMERVGKKAAGSLLDGVEHKAFPTGSERP